MRLQEAVNFSKGDFPDPEQWANLEFSGLVIRYGTPRCRMIALRNDFPASAEFRLLLLALELTTLKGEAGPTLPFIESRPPQLNGEPSYNHTDLFGYRFQTVAIMAVCLNGGMLDRPAFNNVLLRQGSSSISQKRVIEAVQKRIVLEVDDECVNIHRRFPARDALVGFVEAFVKFRPEFAFRPQPLRAAPPVPIRKSGGRLLWQKSLDPAFPQETVESESSDIPLLFGNIGRFRIIVALALAETLPPSELVRACRIGRATIDRLKTEGFLVFSKAVVGRHRALCKLNPNLPAYDELIALARKLSTTWPPPLPTAAEGTAVEFTPKPWKPGIERYFGSSVRSQTLLTLSAMQRANLRTLERGVKQSNRHEVTRAVHMFQHYQIVRRSNVKRNLFEINPTWFAAEELRMFLTALRQIDGRYDARAITDEGSTRSKSQKIRL